MKVRIEFEAPAMTGTVTVGDKTYNLTGIEFSMANDVREKEPRPGQEFVEFENRGPISVSFNGKVVLDPSN